MECPHGELRHAESPALSTKKGGELQISETSTTRPSVDRISSGQAHCMPRDLSSSPRSSNSGAFRLTPEERASGAAWKGASASGVTTYPYSDGVLGLR